jgi:hypothetical protein
MANVRVNWVLPATRESGNPLPVADIDHVGIEVSADGVTFASVGTFLTDVLETLVEGLDTGVWVFRGTVTDVKGRVSKPAVRSVTIDESAPAVVALTLTLV